MIKTRKKQIFLLALAGCSMIPMACTTLDYDDELNKSHQELIRLHQEDEKIKDEILTASYSLDILIEQMSERMEGELGRKLNALEQSIDKEDSLIRVFLKKNVGDADSLLNVYDQKTRRLLSQKEQEFSDACDTLKKKMNELADSGYEANVVLMQQGIDKLNRLQETYDSAYEAMSANVEAIKNLGTRIGNLKNSIKQTQDKRDKILAGVETLKGQLQNIAKQQISDAKNSEEYIQRLKELQQQYETLMGKMQTLVDSFSFDDMWYLEVDDYINNIESLLSDSEEGLERAADLQDLIDSFDASQADDILGQIASIYADLYDLTSYDLSEADDIESKIAECEGYYDDVMDAAHDIEDMLSELEDMVSEAEDFKSW